MVRMRLLLLPKPPVHMVSELSMILSTHSGQEPDDRVQGIDPFLEAVGYVIPLMDEEYSNYYTSQIRRLS
jgi:hypothetical protein